MALSNDNFIQRCVEDYELLLDDKYFSLTTIAELQICHQILKKQLIGQLPEKWKSFSPTKMPAEIPNSLSLKLDETFEQLSKHFEKSKLRVDGMGSVHLVKQTAINYYTKEMGNYVSNHPRAVLDELQIQHDSITHQALEHAKSESGATLTAQTVAVIKAELQSRHKMFQERVQLNITSSADPALGIDLGTTNCCVMVYHLGKVNLIPNRAQGNSSTTPSYVAFHDEGDDTFGKVAKEESYRHPEITIYDAKRMIGRPWSDDKLQADREKWPFEVVNDNDNPKIKTNDITRYPHEISARLLTRFRKMAEEHLQMVPGTIRKAVITVPAYFTEPQRRATSQAAQCAGLEVLKILSEPTAAAIAYCWEPRDNSDARNVLVYDLGGGTFDVAIAKVKSNDVEILGVDGDTHLGGRDFDQLLMEHCMQEFKTKENLDLQADRNSDNDAKKKLAKRAICRLKLQCEIVKERLATAPKANVEVDSIYQGKDMVVTITKEKFESLVSHLVQQTIDIVARALDEMKSKGINNKSEIDDIILVGGSTRIPLVMKKLEEYFDGKQLSMHINPDEAVAYGAAVQAAILNNASGVKKIIVQDVTPLPVGISVDWNRKFAEVIPKNAKIPCEHRRKFATCEDNQTKIRVEIFQGESNMCKDNKQLGDFLLQGLQARPADAEKIWVKMTIDTSGILHVEAESIATAKKDSIMITAERLGMNDADMERVTKECAAL